MRAIVVDKPGTPDVLQLQDSSPIPSPQPNELVIKVVYAGINYIDIYQRSGSMSRPTPYTPGMEGSGTVHRVGNTVKSFKEGDQVAFLCTGGSYAQYVTVDASKVARCDNLRSGAAVLLQGMTAGYLTRMVDVRGKTVLSYAAAGGTGALTCQMAKALGASKVIGVVSSEAKAEMAKAYCDQVIVGYQNLKDQVGQVDIVYDSVGKDTIDTSLAITKRCGHVISFGGSSGFADKKDLFGLNAVFVTGASLFLFTKTAEEFSELAEYTFKMLKEEKIKLSIHKEYLLAEAAKAHADLSSRQTSGKLLLKID